MRPCFDTQKQMVFAYFWPSGGSKIDQKSIKFVHPKMVQDGSNMAPKSTQVGAMLGSKTVMDPPKSEAKTMSKKCLQEIDFLSHLGSEKTHGRLPPAARRLDPPGGWIARIARIVKSCLVSSTAAPRKAGGAGSTCPAGQPRHRALGLS